MGRLGESDYQGDHLTEVSLLSAAVMWVTDLRQGRVNPLLESPWLKTIEGLDSDRLGRIEESFLCQIDDLELVARQLA
jgi:hypothetical protein